MNFSRLKHFFSIRFWGDLSREVSFLMIFPVFLVLFMACENEIAKIKVYSSTENLPSVTAEGYEMLFSDSTVTRYKLKTPELITHDKDEKEPYYEFPRGVLIQEYDAKMNITSSITAQYAKNFISDNRWEAKNNVIAVNQKGDSLKTEFLVWDTRKQKIYSDQFVTIIQKDQTFMGTGFESNQDFTQYSFKNLKGHIYFNVNK
jgi:LPS export ABC transporter protein LptC